MATPYLQIRVEEVSSTQDRAREELGDLPVVVIAQRQTAGRGRAGAPWMTAPRALAVSLALRPNQDDRRPFSLMAGVAAARAVDVTLKWPNDLLRGEAKVGGILVELGEEIVVGMGLNLWWSEPPEGAGAVLDEDPGPELHAEIAGIWAAELMQLIEDDGWPIAEYRNLCSTIGQAISWEPEGRGRAIDVDQSGALVVDIEGERRLLSSGVVHHVRSAET